MKAKQNRFITSIVAGACIFSIAVSTHAQDSSRADADARRATGADRPRPDVEQVRVTRASNYLGTDVVATDGRKVGDIVDYYFNVGAAPRIEYVVVMTGGFLNMGGDNRAVPASALTVTGDACRIDISSSQFWDVPVMPSDRQRFISDAQHRQRISQIFARTNRTAANQTGAAGVQQSSSAAEDPNRAGAPTGRMDAQATQLISFNELRNSDAYGQEAGRLGFFMDAWVNLDEGLVPYVEITPTFQPFRTSYDRRYAIPTSKLGAKREYFGYTVNVTSDELNNAEPVTEAEGVRMLEEGRFGNTVLRVTVPER